MNINQLLDKYWAAETTLDEEAKLQQYFQSEDIAEEHQSFQFLFNGFDQLKEIRTDKEFQQPDRSINSTETVVKNLPLKDTKIKRLPYKRYIGIAASLLIAMMILFNPFESNKQNNNVVEIDTPEEALAYTKQALAMVSTKLSRGSSPFVKSMKAMKKAQIITRK